MGRDLDGESESIFRDSSLLRFDPFSLFASRRGIPGDSGPRFWESCDSRFCAAKICFEVSAKVLGLV